VLILISRVRNLRQGIGEKEQAYQAACLGVAHVEFFANKWHRHTEVGAVGRRNGVDDENQTGDHPAIAAARDMCRPCCEVRGNSL
jgi:hypothetical protein